MEKAGGGKAGNVTWCVIGFPRDRDRDTLHVPFGLGLQPKLGLGLTYLCIAPAALLPAWQPCGLGHALCLGNLTCLLTLYPLPIVPYLAGMPSLVCTLPC